MDTVNRNTSTLQSQNETLARLEVGQRNTREISNISNWESDSDGRVTYVSASLCEMIGYSAEQFMHDSWKGFVVDKDRDRVFKSWKDSVQNASHFSETFLFRKFDGSFIRVSAIALHNKDKYGKVLNSIVRLDNAPES